MTGHDRPSRRLALGLLGAVPLAAALTRTAEASARSSGAGRIPQALRPGGDYDRFLKNLADEDEFSGTVLVAYRGKTVLARAYGMADKEREVPNRIDTIYNLASTAKPFTGLAIIQLAQQGKLRLTAPLGTYLDGFSRSVADHVTIHHLLTHTSGLSNYAEGVDIKRVTSSVEEEIAFRKEMHRRAETTFTPGSGHAYSSLGFSILGEVVETLTGTYIHDYIAANIFAPAKMTSSKYYTRHDWLTDERIAHPYIYQRDGSRVDGVRNLDAGATINGGEGTNAARSWLGSGGGGGFSTAPDLVRFALALESGKLLRHNRAWTELYMGSKIPIPPRPGSTPPTGSDQGFSGYGATAHLVNDQRLFGHGGGIAGGNANWTIYRDSDWIGIILCNYDLDIQSIISREREAVFGSTS